ncbi:hypothetical protein [Candidatus Hamiltonella defensa]|uniref:hypothetical protein n=1 Tax=Candidatus Williamhamiltonella defendens TaxID=138072 RepID=UPI0030DA9A39
MTDKKNFNISDYLISHANLGKELNLNAFEAGIQLIKEKFFANKKIITCGNGGSASTASHYITDWNKMVNLATGKKFRGSLFVTTWGSSPLLETIFLMKIYFQDNWQQ